MNPRKYVWSDMVFEKWIKEQQKKLKDSGFEISTAGVTRKLAVEILFPNKIEIKFPVMELKKKKNVK